MVLAKTSVNGPIISSTSTARLPPTMHTMYCDSTHQDSTVMGLSLTPNTKGTKVLTLGTVGVYTTISSLFHRLPTSVGSVNAEKSRGHTYACISFWVYIIIEAYMLIHDKYTCGTDMQLPASRKVNTQASYVDR